MRPGLRRNPLPALAAALGLAAFYALAASATPGRALGAFFLGPFSSAYSFLSLLDQASPLLLCALGAAVAFRSGAFNLGGEGQAALGALSAALVLGAGSRAGLAGGAAPLFILALALLAAAAAGALLALLSALGERLAGAEVLLTSFLLSQAAVIGVDWAVAGPLRDPASNLLAMPALPRELLLPRVAPPAPLNAGVFVSLALCLAAAFLLGRTRAGYELDLRGESPAFARAQGLSQSLSVWPLALSGGLHGLAGALLVAGAAGRAVKGMTGGIGWNGISVALVAGANPLAALPASVFFAWLDSGARSASILADLSPDSSAVMKAAVLFLVTADLRLLAPGRRGKAGPAARGALAGAAPAAPAADAAAKAGAR